MDVHRLHGIAAGQVHDVETLAQLQEVTEILLRARAAAAVGVGAVRRAGYLAEGDPVVAELHMARRVARVQDKSCGCGGHGLQDQATIDAHALAFYPRPRMLKNIARFGVQEIHADFFEDGQRGVVDRLDLVGGQNFRRRELPARLTERFLRNRAGSGAPPSRPAAAARHLRDVRGLIHVC